ncbi:hypothetical protein [Alteromonas lipotrueae]|uniref:hypothetical protein n=1 Tax=Alteromonas lipotrueae TaxID=2803814 RepID=UPI001C4442E4|nr:hypothetical protein [Alteromonas lipotrueae]
MSDLLIIFIGAAAILNVCVSIFVASRNDLETFQKVAQIVIVWLIPLLAAIGIYLLNKDSDEVKGKLSNFKNFGKDDRGCTNHLDP